MTAPVLALVPGLNNTARVWDGLVGELAQTFECRALECPVLESVEAIADALLAQLPNRFWLAGFSFGGYVALAMLERAPQRVAGVALINTSARSDNDAQRAARTKSILAAQAGEHEVLVAAQAALAFHPNSLSNAAIMDARHAMVRDYGSARFIAHLRACMARPDRTAVLQEFKGPLLVVAASDDRVIATAQQRASVSDFPRARYAEIAEAGHMLPVERPAALAKVMRDWQAETGV
jgi:pimeloyl-ACP methyl ester carboxylesterase